MQRSHFLSGGLGVGVGVGVTFGVGVGVSVGLEVGVGVGLGQKGGQKINEVWLTSAGFPAGMFGATRLVSPIAVSYI